MDLIGARISPYLMLAALLAPLGDAQEPHSPNPASSSGNSTSVSAKTTSAGTDRVILKVGDAQVTESEFESRIAAIEPQSAPDKDSVTEKDRRKLGDDYASVLMLSQQAVANHLDSSPEVSRQLAIARMQVLSDAEFENLMRQATPSSEEISQYYSAHLSDYDEVQIRRLFIWKQRDNSKNAPVLTSQAARASADQVRKAYASGANLKNLSEDVRKSGEGMLDPEPLTFPRGELPPQLEKVAFALKEGEWSEVEDTPARPLLIQLVKRDRQQLGQVSARIEKNLQGEKIQALLDDLKKKAGIWMDEQYFGTAVVPVPGAQRRVSVPPSELQESAKKGGTMKTNRRSRSFCYLALSVSLLAACVFQPSLASAQMTSMGVDCAQINVPSLMMQDNMRAGRILIECGIVQGGQPTAASATRKAPAPPNIRVSNGSDCSGSADVCGSESMVAASTADKGQTIVVNYNAEFGTGASYTGTSYSTDGGATFKEIQPPPFATAHGFNAGDPIVVFNSKLGKFFAGDLVGSCGGQGVGLWTSKNGKNWTVGACAHKGGFDD